MPKFAAALVFLPLVAACAGTTAMSEAKTAEECKMVANDDLGSNIKFRKVCTAPAKGASVDTSHQPQSLPAPR